jgi:hypothetical protein
VSSERGRNILGWTWAASVVLHVGLIGGFGWFALRSLEAKEAAAARAAPAPPAGAGGLIAIELPGVAEGSLLTEHRPDPKGDPPQFFGGAPTARPDQEARGRGGERSVDAPATNLSDRDDRLRRTLDPIDRLERDQAQRIKSDHERASWEDRRSSKEPMELSFLASGDGTRAERRTPSPRDPSRGGAAHSTASTQGGALGDRPRPEEDGPEARIDAGADHEGSLESAPGMGVHDAHADRDHRLGAHVMRARPDVVIAAVSVPAARRGRPRDDIDSDPEVATAVRSLVHTSTAGGVLGDGHGGSAGGGEAGAGGRAGVGSMGRPMGPGDSEWWDLNTNDPRLLPYFRRIHSKLDPLWAHAFPLEAALELRQGTVIFDVTIAHDGSASPVWPPRRPSGVPEFDRNCFDAIQRASPFDPIPAELGASELHVRMPFDAKNYIVK